MVKRKGLGRGLDALLSGSVPSGVLESPSSKELKNLPIELVRRGRFQPRIDMDPTGLEELTNSIRAQGVVQPIIVRLQEDGEHYEIIAGERRWRAAQAAGLAEIPAVLRDVPDEEALAIALIENIQRENLNPIEEARALRRLIAEFRMTHEAAADAVGRSRAAVSNLLRLLDLKADVRVLLEQGELEMGHARALLGLDGEWQSQAAAQVVSRGLSARETERLVRRYKISGDPRGKRETSVDPDISRLEERLSARLGAPVRIRHAASGKGKLTIEYASLDQLDGILDRLE